MYVRSFVRSLLLVHCVVESKYFTFLFFFVSEVDIVGVSVHVWRTAACWLPGRAIFTIFERPLCIVEVCAEGLKRGLQFFASLYKLSVEVYAVVG
jgi:hypothetical protein